MKLALVACSSRPWNDRILNGPALKMPSRAGSRLPVVGLSIGRCDHSPASSPLRVTRRLSWLRLILVYLQDETLHRLWAHLDDDVGSFDFDVAVVIPSHISCGTAMSRVKNWFDNLEDSLESEARNAGLLEHGTLIGNAREFLARRVLRSVLPPMVHIGTGKIIDADQNRASKQIDIVIFDPRFPVLEIDHGMGLYPIEGVIATVEVKSRLDKRRLIEALENTASVLSLSSRHVRGPDDENVISDYCLRDNIGRRTAIRKLRYEFLPACYVFAIESIGSETMQGHVRTWFDNSQSSQRRCLDGNCAALPRVIVAGQTVGVFDDGFFQLTRPNGERQKSADEFEIDDPILMAFWTTKHRLGILASHLWHTAATRLGLRHRTNRIAYSIDSYLPIDEYSKEMADEDAFQFCWPE